MKKYITFLFCIISTLSCQEHSLFENNPVQISNFPKEISLKPEKIKTEIIGINNLYIIDSMFMGFNARGSEGFFSCYSLPDFHLLGNCITSGRGADEFLTLTYNKQFIKDTSAIKMWISSHLSREVSEFNLTSSIKEQKTIFDKRFLLDSITDSYWFNINDSLFAAYSSTDNLYYTVYNLKTQKPLMRTNIYKKNIKFDPFTLDITGVMSPDRTKIALAMFNLNHIIIHSVDGNNIKPLTIYHSSNTIHEISLLEPIDRKTFYSDIRATNEYIFALYINRTGKMEDIETNKGIEIHMFDWNGNPIQKISIPNYIRFFDIDPQNEYIYGLNPYNEELFRYNIKPILKNK